MEQLENTLLPGKVEVLYDQWTVSTIATLTVAPILVGVLWREASPSALLAWLGILVLVSLVRFYLVASYRRCARRRERASYWLRLFIVGVAASGVVWGLSLGTLIPNGSIVHKGFVVLWLCGLAAGSVASLAVSRSAYFAFTLPALVPGTVHLLLSNRPQETVLALAVLLFLVFIGLAAVRMHGTLLHTLALRNENAQLVLELETRVSSRTIELERTNERLELEISERKNTELALRASQERYRSLYNDNPAILLTVDADGTILSINRFGADQMGYTLDELAGTSIFDLFHESDRETVARELSGCLDAPDEMRQHEFRKRHKDGRYLWVRMSLHMIEEAPTPLVLVAGEDITEARSLSQQLAYQASHDALTGLANRREFERRLRRVLETVREKGTENALCYIDLDQFKVVNDTCGHSAGDALLRELSQVLKTHVRKSDTLARLGGDEFGVVMEHCSVRQARRVAGAMKTTIRDYRFHWEGRTLTVGASMGLVAITDTFTDIAEVLREADAACYIAKDAGGDQIHTFSENDLTLLERRGAIQWVARINQALADGRFHLYVQPIVPTDPLTERGLHCEVLLRMLDESGAVVMPGEFLPAAERYGLATKIDMWAIDATFAWLSEGAPEALSLCGINLSGHSLANDDFLQFVLRKLDELPVPAQKVCFEITETAAIANFDVAREFIFRLKERGCWFALDDFGSGLSSFAYLKSLPVDFLKIDGIFVKSITRDVLDLAMVKSINELGKLLGKQTIAEFVEDRDTFERLAEIGVDYAQGFGVGRPRPIEEIGTLLRRMRSLERT